MFPFYWSLNANCYLSPWRDGTDILDVCPEQSLRLALEFQLGIRIQVRSTGIAQWCMQVFCAVSQWFVLVLFVCLFWFFYKCILDADIIKCVECVVKYIILKDGI